MMSMGFGIGSFIFGVIALIIYLIGIVCIISVPVLLILIYLKLKEIDSKLNKDK